MPEDPKRNQEGPGKKPKTGEPTGPDPGKKPKSGAPPTEEPTRDDLQKDKDEKEKEFKAAEKKLQDFDAANKEIDKAVEDYGKAFEKLKKERFDLDDYITTKSLMIGVVVKDEKADEIKKVVRDIGKDIIEAEKKSEKAFNDAKKNHDDAVTTLKTFQDAYEAAKGFQKEIETRLKTLDNNRKSIEQEEGSKKYAVMYYLNDIENKEVLERLNDSCANLKKLLKDEIPKDEDKKKEFIQAAKNEFRDVFKEKLNDARKELEEKEKGLNVEGKKKKMQDAETAYKEAQKALADFNKDKKSKLLEELRKIEFKEEV
jgi:chromosome segregation ATPase